MKKAKGDRGAIKFALDALGPAPTAPRVPVLTCPEPTYEGLCRLFAGGEPSIGVFSSEGGQFIGGHGLSEDKKLLTAAGLSGLWDGEPIKRVRAGDGASILPGRRVAMHLMAQPDVAAVMLSDRVNQLAERVSGGSPPVQPMWLSSDMGRAFCACLSVPCHSLKVRRMNLHPECCRWHRTLGDYGSHSQIR